ncbi:FAD dependent oxidoreductase [Penicillium taxi]|uniref:FAD dependent oxidoreductase n=1 Tax=Penicillium taxi TaxID=168475 RepID=UPI0025453EBD|nr:FAD dependent oxidoreductase [Penicillium taxi]KAJ5887465.1 FAD dependent oxidoreductase [Penicillium taxi]
MRTTHAPNHLIKIVRLEHEDQFYADLTIRAILAWKTPLFALHFYQTGLLHCVSDVALDNAVETLRSFQEMVERHLLVKLHVVPIKGGDDVRQVYQQLIHEPLMIMPIYEKDAVDKILYKITLAGRKFVGIRTKNDQPHHSKLLIVAAGAGAGCLALRVGQQVTAKSWSIAYNQLTSDEVSVLHGVPVTQARNLNLFFEPDLKTGMSHAP